MHHLYFTLGKYNYQLVYKKIFSKRLVKRKSYRMYSKKDADFFEEIYRLATKIANVHVVFRSSTIHITQSSPLESSENFPSQNIHQSSSLDGELQEEASNLMFQIIRCLYLRLNLDTFSRAFTRLYDWKSLASLSTSPSLLFSFLGFFSLHQLGFIRSRCDDCRTPGLSSSIRVPRFDFCIDAKWVCLW